MTQVLSEWAARNGKPHSYEEIPPPPGANVATHTAWIIIGCERWGPGTGRTNRMAREAAASQAAQVLLARGEPIYG
ncbi:hypothetical protein FRC20_011048 [Serendipita sp. 405]|nr:hypothetical protein FRC15_000519 [Serendipita sp. 397]KAG8862835.1 hypothetical protein FRC20_011048 [Serendipita sp. 405]